MADKQSREVQHIAEELFEAAREAPMTLIQSVDKIGDEIFVEILGRRFKYVGSGEPERNPDIKLNVDIFASEVIKGLKAVQREAKEATRALRELESAQQSTMKAEVDKGEIIGYKCVDCGERMGILMKYSEEPHLTCNGIFAPIWKE